MIDKLDKALKEIKVWVSYGDCHITWGHLSSDNIAQIKQAIIDDGWRPVDNRGRMFLSKPELLEIMKDKRLTGEEWLERFIKELWIPPKQELPINQNDGGESHDRFYRVGGEQFMYQRALEAARKASGQ